MGAFERFKSSQMLGTVTKPKTGGAYGRFLAERGIEPETIPTEPNRVERAKETIKDGLSVYSDFPNKVRKNINDGAADIQEGMKIGGIKGVPLALKGMVKAGFRTAGDAAITLFAPFSVAIGLALEQTGGQRLIDETGKVIADKSGITDMPAFQKFAMEHPEAGEDFERGLTILMSGLEKGEIKPGRAVAEIKAFTDKITGNAPKKLSVTSGGEVNQVKVGTPKSRYSEYLESQGYEPYATPETLPTIDIGQPAPQGKLPVIQTEARATTKQGSFTVEPIREPITKTSAFERFKQEKTAPETFGDKKTSTTLVRLKDKAIAEGIVSEFPDLATYNPITLVDQISRSEQFIARDPVKALRVAKGEIQAPADVANAKIVYKTLERLALENGDAATILELGKSTIPKEAGQGLVSLREQGNFEVNPVQNIRQLRELKLEEFAKNNKGKSAEQATKELIKTTVEKTPIESVGRQKWIDFINNLEC